MALAASLQRLGIPSLVLERAPQLGEVGAGLGLLPNAVRALLAIGVSRDLFRQGGPFRRFRICSDSGEELKEIDFQRAFRSGGGEGYVVHRASLHAALAKCVDGAAVRTGASVSRIEPSDGGVKVYVDGDPTPVSGVLLVGADGLNSIVRAHVLDDGPPRYAGETIFRGIVDRQIDPPDLCREVMGAGQRTAFYDLGKGRCYWWATSPVPVGTIIPEAERSEYLQQRFARWPFGIPQLFAETPTRQILQNDIFDRDPAPTWHRGRVVLLGDAAHPTTPNLGQGACMAIEDAVVLARAIAYSDDAESAFAQYYSRRSGRTARIVRMSRWWGKSGLWKSPPLVWMRDRGYRLMPLSWYEAGMRDQYNYDAGTLEVEHER
jgi:2-polyprenyl-6-methoxyphenol hydroxylase-like FAD-dependent oxidoreductase